MSVVPLQISASVITAVVCNTLLFLIKDLLCWVLGIWGQEPPPSCHIWFLHCQASGQDQRTCSWETVCLRTQDNSLANLLTICHIVPRSTEWLEATELMSNLWRFEQVVIKWKYPRCNISKCFFPISIASDFNSNYIFRPTQVPENITEFKEAWLQMAQK